MRTTSIIRKVWNRSSTIYASITINNRISYSITTGSIGLGVKIITVSAAIRLTVTNRQTRDLVDLPDDDLQN